ncbi:MAG: hypothetical protein M3Y34_09745 [Actinomycetota bacterium]|nr:hypothetical protein [Actinomycetota bacterium]
MSSARVLIAGESKSGEGLAASLGELGVAARFEPADGLAGAFVDFERALEDSRPEAAVAVGAGQSALTLGITAAKLGIPLARTAEEGEDPDRARILATLADFDAGSPGRAAELIAAWLREDPPPPDLD